MSLTKIGSIGINTGIQLAGVTTVSTLKVGSGITLSSDGDIFATGITTIQTDSQYNGVFSVGGSLQFFTDSATCGILSRRSSGANILLNDNDTSSKIRTVDGRLHLHADEENAVDDSEIRFVVDGDIQGVISAGSSFSLSNDGDTFLGHPSSNTLTVTTQGSERVRIEQGGNVGVATNNPSSALHVHGSGGSTSGLKISNAFDDVIHYFQNDNDNSDYIISYTGTGSPEIELKSNGFVAINRTGKKGVGVGVASSFRDAAFTVAANVAGVSTALSIINENNSSTGTEIVTNKNLILSADSEDNSGTSVSNIIFKIDAEEKARIESNGKMLLGSNAVRNIGGSSSSGQIQIEGTGGNNSSMQLIRNSADTGSSFIRFGKTRGTSTGAVTTVADGDHLGHITFNAADGTDVNNTVALMRATVNGTVAENQIPTDLVFETSASSGGNRAERLRITSAGNIGINQSTPTAKLQVTGGGAYTVADSGRSVEGIDIQSSSGDVNGAFGGAISFGVGNVGRSAIAAVQNDDDDDNTGLAFFTHPSNTGTADAEEKVRIQSDGKVGIGTASANTPLHVHHSTINGVALFESGDAYCHITLQDSNSNASTKPQFGVQGNVFRFVSYNGTSAAEKLRIQESGQVGINTDGEFGATNNVRLLVDGDMAIRNSSKGDNSVLQMGVYGKAVTMTTSSLDLLQFNAFGNGAVEITVFRRDTVNPQGASISKLYIAFGGSGNNITSATLVQEDKVTRGSIHNFTYSISENNTHATLSATGDNNGGESQTLDFHCISSGGNNRTITVL